MKKEFNIDWAKQHCGVHQGSIEQVVELMPDLIPLVHTFPENAFDFVWDVKVHMLMPGQFPCVPNWHYDNVPRVNNKQQYDLLRPDKPMYIWLSNAPLTEFRKGEKSWFVEPRKWVRFTQQDEHRGTCSTEFCWRGFVRATHKDILVNHKFNYDPHRRHCQVYLDAQNFTW